MTTPQELYIAFVDPAKLGIIAKTVPPERAGNRTNVTQPISASEAVRQSPDRIQKLVSVNHSYANQQVRYLTIDRKRSLQLTGDSSVQRVGRTYNIVENRVVISAGASASRTARVALQTIFIMIENGQVVDQLASQAERYRVTLIGILEDSRMFVGYAEGTFPQIMQRVRAYRSAGKAISQCDVVSFGETATLWLENKGTINASAHVLNHCFMAEFAERQVMPARPSTPRTPTTPTPGTTTPPAPAPAIVPQNTVDDISTTRKIEPASPKTFVRSDNSTTLAVVGIGVLAAGYYWWKLRS